MKSPIGFPRFAHFRSAGWALLALFALTLFAPLSSAFAAETTCSVAPSGASYSSIQAAVNDGNCATINVAAGTYFENVVIKRNVTINGAMDGSTIIDGNNAQGVAFIQSATVTLSHLTFQHGNASGILVAGGVTVWGGALVNLISSTVRDNYGAQGGGGISMTGSSSGVNIVNSTVANNSGVFTSGVYVDEGSANLINSTVARNSGGAAGAINNLYGSITLKNSIVANNNSGSNCAGAITNSSHNMISDTSCGNGSAADPKLDPNGLQQNGGSTATIALLPDSPAINAGDDAVCSGADVGGVDQRGIARPAGSHCDIGAYEATATDAPVVKVSFPTPTGQNGWFTSSPVVGSVTAQSLSRITGVNCSGAAFSDLSISSPFFAQGVLTATGDGTYTISCNSGDVDGHHGAGAGSRADATVKIDTTAPTVSGSFSQTSPAASATVTLNANDATSGIASTSYTINGGASHTYHAPFVFNAVGAYHISFTSVDNAGNGAQAQSLTVTIVSPTINHSPSIQVIDAPPSVAENTLESDQSIRMFPERLNYTLPQAITVNGTVIPAGTKVNVYYIHADKVGNNNSTPLKLVGSVTFDTKVLAVLSNGTALKNTHSALGSATTTYSASLDQGIENDDKVSLTSTQNRVDVAFNLWSMTDDVRVITLAP